MSIQWPPEHIHNEFGIATLSLGNRHHHNLEVRLKEAAKAGFKRIDLFDDDWAAYLSENNRNPDELWEATEANLNVASKLGQLIKSLGMRVACTQPCREIEGIKDPIERQNALDSVAKRFPFMRAWDTDLVFLCANIRRDSGVTSDFKTVAKDLAELGKMAEAFSKGDGGPMIRIGYEGLSWAVRNTWSSTWEVVRAANRSNVGLVLDSFNILAVEFADPYNPAGHGRICSTVEESIQILQSSLAALAVTVPGEKIFFFQVADAELVDPKTFRPPENSSIPGLLPWSRGHRLFPCENEKGGYMPVDMVTAAVLATGYRGPISLEVFNDSLSVADVEVPEVHAKRGYAGLKRLIAAMQSLQPFWKR